MNHTSDIVDKLWLRCHILRDGGITYHQYATELTLLLFLKMAQETSKEQRLPKGCRWGDLLGAPPGGDRLELYKDVLLTLGRASDPLVRAIYAGAQTALREARHLDQLVLELDALDWFSAKTDGLGDLYEGLLQKNANETKSGAGQYFTPRPLIEAMVEVMRPQAGEVIQDPAAGTAGFLIAADTYIKRHTDQLFDLGAKQQEFQKRDAFVGLELVPETRRLALMNCMLHDIEGVGEGAVRLGDTLSNDGASLPKAHLILTNPPFGTKKGAGGGTRDDLTFPTSNKQLMFLQHIYRGLLPGGRAAVVLPDNVLFEEGRGREVRADLMDKCNLHTILRLPTGIFYAQGVKTNVLCFTRGEKDKGNTKRVWVYDLRTNAPSFGKRTPFTREYLQPFVAAFGNDPTGEKHKRKDEGEQGRFRAFTREDVAKRNDNLDISWLKDDSAHDEATVGEPDEIAAEIRVELQAAMEDLSALENLLGGGELIGAETPIVYGIIQPGRDVANGVPHVRPALLDRLKRSILAAAFRGDLTADWRAAHPDVEPARALLDSIRVERGARVEVTTRANGKARAPRAFRTPIGAGGKSLGDLPQGWTWASVDELAELQLGQQRAPIHANAKRTHPYVRAANITWDGLDLSDIKEMGFPDPERYRLRYGDVLLSEASGSASEVGKPAIWRDEIQGACYQKTLLRARPRSPKIMSEWLHAAFLADAMLGRFAHMAPGVGILHLTAERMLGWPVPLAPLQEQQVLVERLRGAMGAIARLEHAVTSVLRSVERTEQSALARAFRGELVDQDPNDEPATVLLDSVRAAQPAVITASRTGPKHRGSEPGAARRTRPQQRKPRR